MKIKIRTFSLIWFKLHKNFYWSSFITVAVNHLISYYSLFLNLSRSDVQIQKLNLHIFSRNFVLLKINPRNTSQNYPRKNKPSQKMIKKSNFKTMVIQVKSKLFGSSQIKTRLFQVKSKPTPRTRCTYLQYKCYASSWIKAFIPRWLLQFQLSMLIKGFRYLALRIMSDFLFEVRW